MQYGSNLVPFLPEYAQDLGLPSHKSMQVGLWHRPAEWGCGTALLSEGLWHRPVD